MNTPKDQQQIETLQDEVEGMKDIYVSKPQIDCMKEYKRKSWYQDLTINWMEPIMNYTQTNDLAPNDIGSIEQSDSCQVQGNKMKEAWSKHRYTSRHPLLQSVYDCYKWPVFNTIAIVWVCILLETINIYILKDVMGYIEGEHDNISKALFSVALMVLFEGTSRACHMACDRFQLKAASRIMVGIQRLTYAKFFTISSATNKKYKKGDLNNMINSDVHTINRLIWELPHITSLPILVATCCFTLYTLVGWVFLFALVLVIATCFVFYYLCKFTERLWKKIMKNNDNRSNVLTEIIDNIKVIKMNSYTQCFSNKIFSIRNKEFLYMVLGHLNHFPHIFFHTVTFYGLIFGVFFISVFIAEVPLTVSMGIVMLRTLGHMKWHTNHLPDFTNRLTQTFVSINRIQDFLQCEELEYHKVAKMYDENNEYSVRINKSNFFWGLEEAKDDEEKEEDDESKKKETHKPEYSDDSTESDTDESCKLTTLSKRVALKDVDIQIKKGEFVAVIGDVGSGKSSLISSVLGEMLSIENETIEEFKDMQIDLDNKTEDSVKEQLRRIKQTRQAASAKSGPKIIIDGSISLIEQKPFILNDTIRGNILFGEELDKDRYNRIIERCQLVRDLEILKGGDLTEIGEQGINLSGGQKARISIARAVYANKDIILMDDPLSALDAHVKRRIFDKVCLDELRDKTKILVTHAIDFLDRVDRIIMMKKGKIVNQGTYDELKDDMEFQKVISHIAKAEHKDINDDLPSSESDEDKDEPQKDYMSTKGHRITDEDDKEDFGSTWSLYWRYINFSKFAIAALMAGTVMMIMSRYLDMYNDYSLVIWVKEFSTTNNLNIDMIWKIVFYCAAEMVLNFLNHFTYIAQAFSLDSKLFKNMISKMMNAPINLYFDKTTSGKVLKKFNHHLEMTTKHLPGAFTWNLHDICRISMTIGLLAYTSPICLVVLPVFVGFLMIVLKRFVKFRQRISKLETLRGSPCDTHINESIDGISTIRTFKMVNKFEDKFCELKDNDYCIEILDRYSHNWLIVRLNLFAVAFVAIAYVYFIYNRGAQDSVLVGILLGKLIELQWNMCGLVHSSYWVSHHLNSFKRCIDMDNIPQEAEAHKEIPIDENGEQWMSKGHIKFNNYSVKYRPDTEVVLKNLSIDIKAGEKVGIVGRTGAGKSTLCLALCRIIEKLEGSIEIDGVDISTVSLADLRDRITIIPQEPVLFDNTLRFNLDPQGKYSDKEIMRIVKKAGLSSIIERDGNGLDFKVGAKGDNLSAGEKALVCICRAALRKSKVVLMDEATASIDVNTEETIQKLIGEEFKEATVLTVAHRLNTIISSDKIMVMSFGEVIEFDSPDSLKNNPQSAFSEMLKQFNS